MTRIHKFIYYGERSSTSRINYQLRPSSSLRSVSSASPGREVCRTFPRYWRNEATAASTLASFALPRFSISRETCPYAVAMGAGVLFGELLGEITVAFNLALEMAEWAFGFGFPLALVFPLP